MAPFTWYVHLENETLGPLSAEVIVVMLKQNRMQFADFVWTQGFPKWKRVSEIEAFSAHMPPYPKKAPPGSSAEATTVAPEVTKKVIALEKNAKSDKVEKVENPKKDWAFIRKFIRVPLEGQIQTEGHGKFKLINISEGGIFVKSSKPLPIGLAVKFVLESKTFGKPLTMTGVVIRHGDADRQTGFALEFTRVNPAYKRLITDFIQTSLDENPQ